MSLLLIPHLICEIMVMIYFVVVIITAIIVMFFQSERVIILISLVCYIVILGIIYYSFVCVSSLYMKFRNNSKLLNTTIELEELGQLNYNKKLETVNRNNRPKVGWNV